LTPAGIAFAITQSWLTGAAMHRCRSSADGMWVCELRNGAETFHVAWNVKGDSTLSIPQQWRAGYVAQLSGGKAAIQGNSIPVGAQPVLIQ
jgi:hypothetical protein